MSTLRCALRTQSSLPCNDGGARRGAQLVVNHSTYDYGVPGTCGGPGRCWETLHQGQSRHPQWRPLNAAGMTAVLGSNQVGTAPAGRPNPLARLHQVARGLRHALDGGLGLGRGAAPLAAHVGRPAAQLGQAGLERLQDANGSSNVAYISCSEAQKLSHRKGRGGIERGS
jgi:hypothetical protein